MNQFLLRAGLRIKRETVKTFGYKPGKSISLERQEKCSDVSHEILGIYSDAVSINIYDPRSQSFRGHYFNERKMFLLENIIFEPRLGVVYSENGNLIEDSVNWPVFQFYNSFPWNPKKSLPKKPLPAAIFLPSSAFGHWISEDLPLTIFALEMNPTSPVIVASNPPKYVLDFLEIIDREIIYIDGPVQLNSLILVQKNQDAGWPHPSDLETLDKFEAFRKIKEGLKPTKRIYASRRGYKRSPKNENRVEMIFEDFGFNSVNLAELNLLEEIKLVASTSVFAGIHGSALSNTVWMQSGGNVLDIVNQNYWTEQGHRISSLKNCNYHFHLYSGDDNAPIAIPELQKKLMEVLSLISGPQ